MILKNIVVGGDPSDIQIDGNKITSVIRTGAGKHDDAEVVDCTGKAALPGFVNMHTHAAMTLMRGMGEDIAFHEWLKLIWEVESKIDAEYVYHATKVACLEMIKTGTTTFNDHYWHMPEAYKAAKEMGLTVSCDLNFRKNLWTTEKAGRVMGELMPYVDVAIANEEDCEKVFGIKADGTDITGGKLSHDGYKDVAKKLSAMFNIPTVAITLRGSISASDNNWAAMLYRDGEYYFSKNYAVHIVDRVGGGDSFGAGLIYALSGGYDNQGAIEFAVAASALKHSIEGDMNEVTVAEVKALAGGDGSGRVQR